MFSLHETTKLRLCRGAFLAVCVAPTCVVLAWCVIIHLPGYTRAHQRTIAACLGLHARLGKASTPRPGTVLYESLELSDPDTLQPLARFPFVEVQVDGSAVYVTLPWPAIINGTRFDALWKAACDTARPTAIWRQLHFEAQDLTVHLGDGDLRFTGLEGQIENNDQHTQLKLKLRYATAGTQAPQPAELSFVRHWQSKRSTSVLQFTTGPTPLPCSLASSIWPGIERLGRTSEFQGRIFVTQQTGRANVQLSGRLSRVDLDVLVGGHFPHTLSGMADCELEAMTIDGGRIETAAGKIVAGPGTISSSLVQNAQSQLHLRAVPDAKNDPRRLLRYRQMACAFAISAQGLALHGEAGQTPGAVLIGDQRILLREPAVLSQPVVNLARALVPQSEVQGPLTRETAALIGLLPLPSIAPASRNEAPATQARSLGQGPKNP